MDNFQHTNDGHPCTHSLSFNNYQLMVNMVSPINTLPTPRLFYFILFLKFIYLFIFGCVGFSLLRAGATLLWCAGFSFWWLLWLQSTGSRHVDSVVVAPRHVGSSWARDRTRVPCIGRRILNHCATREVLQVILIQILVK